MALGDLPISHAGLDQLSVSRPREFVRNILVTAGILQPQPTGLRTTLEWMDSFIAELPSPDQQVMRIYARWDTARHLRAKAARGQLTWHGAQNTRARLRAVAEFLAWLTERDLTLRDARQQHVDEYLAAAAKPVRHLPQFLHWAHQAGHGGPLVAPSHRPELSTAQASDDDRWGAVERLLHEDDTRIDTRVCGLFVLLYGQRLSHICQMTRAQVAVNDGAVTVRFATDPITMPPGADDLVQRLIARPTPAASASPSTAWLFPGRSPGLPIGPGGLGVRLKKAGVKVRAARTAALIQLAAELPAPVLASLLGIHPQTAVTWCKIAARDWNQYAALRKEHSEPAE